MFNNLYINSGPYSEPNSCLYNFLYDYAKSTNHNWVDLEEALLQYALIRAKDEKINEDCLALDKEHFEKLKESFAEYLIKEVVPYINRECRRDNLLSQIVEAIKVNKDFDYFYSFNYTPTKDILWYLDLKNVEVCHIHGQLKDTKYPPILGIRDDVNIPEEYKFLRKSWHDSYENNNLNNDIFNSNIIIFYGLSFGVSDFIYFDSFFKFAIEHKDFTAQKKEIHIFTYDEQSRLTILRGFDKAGINFSHLKSVVNITIHKVSELFDTNYPLAFDRFIRFINLVRKE